MTKTIEEIIPQISFKKIEQKIANLAIFGAGYVGLPTAALFADAGFSVTVVDVQADIVESVNKGVSPLREPGLSELVSRNVKCGKLKAELLSSVTLDDKNIFIITVQTPIDKSNTPNLSFLMNAIEAIGAALKKETIVAICSTVPPGTLQEKVKPLLESLSGLKAESEFYLAYVPERIAPGIALKEFVESPRLVGGIGPNSTKIAAELFRTVCKKVIETDAATAEIAKLAENTFRDVNIAFANQLALICEQNGADVVRVIELANTHPRVSIHVPGPGVGGPCLTKDPYLLVFETGSETRSIIAAARNINDYMPKHVVKLILRAFKYSGKTIKESRVAILGTAYKANVDDSRFSPSEPIIKEIMSLGAKVLVYDPYCKESFGATKVETLNQTVNGADCIVIIIDHTEFKNLKLDQLKELMNTPAIIIDGKRLVDPMEAKKLGFIYYGVGYGNSRD